MALFKRAFAKTGQVVIQVRDVKDSSGVKRKKTTLFHLAKYLMILKKLRDSGFKINVDYIIQFVPNITNITYGRGVGYKIEQESFDSTIESISATQIRKKLREEGKIK